MTPSPAWCARPLPIADGLLPDPTRLREQLEDPDDEEEDPEDTGPHLLPPRPQAPRPRPPRRPPRQRPQLLAPPHQIRRPRRRGRPRNRRRGPGRRTGRTAPGPRFAQLVRETAARHHGRLLQAGHPRCPSRPLHDRHRGDSGGQLEHREAPALKSPSVTIGDPVPNRACGTRTTPAAAAGLCSRNASRQRELGLQTTAFGLAVFLRRHPRIESPHFR